MWAPLSALDSAPMSLDIRELPEYALRTTVRMFVVMGFSLLFTLVVGTLAARSQRARLILLPLLDVLQSVPVLGYLSFTVVVFFTLFPDSVPGAELAAIFAIFTSQVWNMTFGFYQSLRTVPSDLREVASSSRLSPWQRFWHLDIPFATPALVWNAMVSISGGWFFVVACEAIAVGSRTIELPGHRLLRGDGDRAARPGGDRLGTCGDAGRDRPDQLAPVQATGGLVGTVQTGRCV